MQAISTIENGTKLRSPEATHHTPTAPGAADRAADKRSVRHSGHGSAVNPKLRLGDLVRHGRYGTGRVLAHWPDGTIQVRFADSTRSRLVWPSFLDRLAE